MDTENKLYFPYHSLDPEQAIERIKESKGIVPEDDIKRGVEILRKVREKRYNKTASHNFGYHLTPACTDGRMGS